MLRRDVRYVILCVIYLQSFAAWILMVRKRLLLFLLFFPRATPLAPPHSPKSSPSYRTALFVVVTCIVHLIVVLILSFIFIYRFPRYLQQWANILGVLGTILAAIQFLPQIYTTWRLQAVRSLSIPMMCIQTPGSFVWVASLATRLGTAGWSTWGIYLVTGVLQGFLLVMAISFEIRDRKMSKKDSVAGTSDSYDSGIERDGQTREERPPDYEHTRLLGNER